MIRVLAGIGLVASIIALTSGQGDFIDVIAFAFNGTLLQRGSL